MLSMPSLLKAFLLLHFVDNSICNGMAQVVMPANKIKDFSAFAPYPLCQCINRPMIACLGPVLVYSIEVKGIHAMRTTKAQALEQFRYNWKVITKQHPRLKNDSVWKREEWSYFTDSLCKEGYITLKQYETWSNPF